MSNTSSTGGGVYDDDGAAQVGGGVYGDDDGAAQVGGGVPQWDGAGGAERRLITAPQLAAALGISTATIRSWRRLHSDMPRPVVGSGVGRRAAAWPRHEIALWLDRKWPGKYRTRL